MTNDRSARKPFQMIKLAGIMKVVHLVWLNSHQVYILSMLNSFFTLMLFYPLVTVKLFHMTYHILRMSTMIIDVSHLHRTGWMIKFINVNRSITKLSCLFNMIRSLRQMCNRMYSKRFQVDLTSEHKFSRQSSIVSRILYLHLDKMIDKKSSKLILLFRQRADSIDLIVRSSTFISRFVYQYAIAKRICSNIERF
jgi:hypothetical protein